eukprot:TRINITY_DN668_c0_g1_i4.p1 TRINITY_DN668_c0_g1~~TRINITY_DN668_c0_g1_i4.p1  ORF type:complete len:278 (-),score=29.08 TRINITY_DN668_c0_g1_i4:109-942(-)
MGIIVSSIVRIVTLVYQIPVQLIATTLFNAFLCLKEVVPMLGILLYGVIITPFSFAFALEERFLRGYCSMICDCRSVKHLILGLAFLSLLLLVLLVLIVLIPILWAVFATVLLVGAAIATISPRQTAILIDPLFKYFELHWYHRYFIEYIDTHSNLDNSSLNLIIFPCITALNLFVVIFTCFTVPFTAPYETISEIKAATELIFHKANVLTYLYLKYKSAEVLSEMNTDIPDGYSSVYANMREMRQEQKNEEPCDGMSITIPKRSLAHAPNEPKTPY